MTSLTKNLLKSAVALVFLLATDVALAFYDPNPSRWITRDPIGERGGVNLYQFVFNDPVNLVDPHGLDVGGRVGPGSPHDGYGSPELTPAEARRKCVDELARKYNLSTDWAYNARKGNFPPGSNKCNKFVYDVIKECGADMNVLRGEWPPRAADWADPRTKIGFWRPLRPGETPAPGDVAAYKIPGGGSAFSGHTGFIVTGQRRLENMSAHDDRVGYVPGQFFDNRNTGYRRYIGP